MKVLIFTGAGISANAGIPTYRQAGSSWVDEDLEQKSWASRYGNHLDELWNKHWGPLSMQITDAVPTKAHEAITDFQKDNEVIVATQNIDGLHERAGNDNVANLHGDMSKICIRCKKNNVEPFFGHGAPKCLDCGNNKTRPNVVLFGETPSRKLFKALTQFIVYEADHVISVGSSLNVFPAAGLVFDGMTSERVTATIINKDVTPLDKFANNVLHGDADELLPEFLSSLS